MATGLRPRDGLDRPSRTHGLAVFDLDRTLIPGSSLAVFGRMLAETGMVSRRHIAREVATEVLFARGSLSDAGLERLATRLLGLAAGREWAPLVAAADDAARTIARMAYPAGRWLIERHREVGDRTVLLSAAPHGLVAAIAKALDIDTPIGTGIEVRDGRITGRLDGPLCHGPGKLARLRDTFGVLGFAQMTAYGDSSADAVLLRACAHPVAVNPDRRLRAAAEAAGWPVLKLS